MGSLTDEEGCKYEDDSPPDKMNFAKETETIAEWLDRVGADIHLREAVKVYQNRCRFILVAFLIQSGFLFWFILRVLK